MSDLSPVALVTNVRAYAGLGSVTGLLEAGHRVYCHDPDFRIEQERAAWAKSLPGVIPLAAQEPVELVAAVVDDAGRIDAVVSNDVVEPDVEGFAAVSADTYRSMLEAGAVWPFRLAQAAIVHMERQRRGAIIFITSATARAPSRSAPLYAAVRGATTTLAVGLGRAYGRSGILVNAIGPNWFDNPSYFPPGWDQRDDQRRELFDKHATLDRLGRSDELGRLVAFLAQRKSMPMTAQYLDFSGNSPI